MNYNKKKLRYFLKYILILSIIFILYFITIIITAAISEYKPDDKEIIAVYSDPQKIPIDSVYSCLIWNIGYAGLGENMDFFYDGGKKVRDKKENVLINIENIGKKISSFKDSVDFIMLQEVDINSKRSYFMNQTDALCEDLPECIKTCALNYNVVYVPIPIYRPLGKVKSGLMSITEILPLKSERYGFNKNYSFPKSLFMLKRCFMVNRYQTTNNKELLMINIHNSAYDDGSLRKEQLNILKTFILDEFEKGSYIVVGGDWNQYPPSFINNFEGYIEDKRNSSVPTDLLPENWKWAYDNTSPTNRDLQTPFNKETITQVIDFYLISPNVEALSVKCIDYHFKHSDHNPVYLSFRLK